MIRYLKFILRISIPVVAYLILYYVGALAIHPEYNGWIVYPLVGFVLIGAPTGILLILISYTHYSWDKEMKK